MDMKYFSLRTWTIVYKNYISPYFRDSEKFMLGMRHGKRFICAFSSASESVHCLFNAFLTCAPDQISCQTGDQERFAFAFRSNSQQLEDLSVAHDIALDSFEGVFTWVSSN